MGFLDRLKKRNRLSTEEAEEMLKAAYAEELDAQASTLERWREAAQGSEGQYVARDVNNFHHDTYRKITDRYLPDPDIPRELPFLQGMRRDVAFFENKDASRIEAEVQGLLATRTGVSIELMREAGNGEFWERYVSEYIELLQGLEREAETGQLPRQALSERLATVTKSHGDVATTATVKTARFQELLQEATDRRHALERIIEGA